LLGSHRVLPCQEPWRCGGSAWCLSRCPVWNACFSCCCHLAEDLDTATAASSMMGVKEEDGSGPQVTEGSGPQINQAITLPEGQFVCGRRGGPKPCVGSELHHLGRCRPCQWFWNDRGCTHGTACLFCHLCDVGEQKKRRKENRRLGKLKKQSSDLNAEDSEGSSSSAEDDHVDVPTALPAGVSGPLPPVKHRSPEAIERERRLNFNFSQYEKLSDEELIALLPKDEAGRPTSIGAMLHASKNCGACTFMHFSKDKNCKEGMRCKFCHDSHPSRDRRSNRKGPRQKKPKRQLSDVEVQQEGGPPKKRPRTDTTISSELQWDNVLEAPLDWMGNSRPCWLEDQDLECHHPSAHAGVGQAFPGLAHGWPTPPAGYPPAGGHPYSGGHLPSWPPR